MTIEQVRELFAKFDEAKALRELGFDEPCYGYYGENDKDFYDSRFGSCRNSIDTEVISAPMYEQIRNWFRKTHNIHIEILTRGDDDEYPMWQYWLVDTKKSNRVELALKELEQDVLIEFNSHQEALDTAIKEAIKKIKINKLPN